MKFIRIIFVAIILLAVTVHANPIRTVKGVTTNSSIILSNAVGYAVQGRVFIKTIMFNGTLTNASADYAADGSTDYIALATDSGASSSYYFSVDGTPVEWDYPGKLKLTFGSNGTSESNKYWITITDLEDE